MRAEYPRGGLVINEDFAVYDITERGIAHRKRIVPERSWGLWHAEQNWDEGEVETQGHISPTSAVYV